ncbi:MAG: carboxylate-amine ligase [Saprospiraceae bacterium]
MYTAADIDDTNFFLLQERLKSSFHKWIGNQDVPNTVVVIPSLTLDQGMLEEIAGQIYYEQRLLCMLMLLKIPALHLTYVTSTPISPLIIDYYLYNIPNIDVDDAKKRLTLLSCYDTENISLTEKVLNRPRLIKRIKNSVVSDSFSHLVFFNVTEHEKKLSLLLDIPVYGCDPSLADLGNKSGSRKIFKSTGIGLPLGFEDIYSFDQIVDALVALKISKPQLKKAVIKLNEGFSGDGNAIYTYPNMDESEDLITFIKTTFKAMIKFVAKGLNYSTFLMKIEKMGGIVEEFLDFPSMMSPSVQVRITPGGEIIIVSTHDQCLGGESGQVFLGATFPASEAYAVDIAKHSVLVAERLKEFGVLGRFSIDFMSALIDGEWQHFAIELNIRKGGTTHPFLMLQFLTDGQYDWEKGKFFLSDGTERFYFATDNIQEERYKGLTPLDMIEITTLHNLHYDQVKSEGVMFHLISALSQYGKFGLVSISKSPDEAKSYYLNVLDVLDQEVSNS